MRPLPRVARAKGSVWHGAGVGLWSPLLRTVKTMPPTMVTGGFYQKVNAQGGRKIGLLRAIRDAVAVRR
jgi:hypothetical protein